MRRPRGFLVVTGMAGRFHTRPGPVPRIYDFHRQGQTAVVAAVQGGGRLVPPGGEFHEPSLTRTVRGGYGGDLSDRVAEVIRRTAAGYGAKEIAAQLDLSAKTVETYKARALEKLGLESRADVVRYASERGWLRGK